MPPDDSDRVLDRQRPRQAAARVLTSLVETTTSAVAVTILDGGLPRVQRCGSAAAVDVLRERRSDRADGPGLPGEFSGQRSPPSGHMYARLQLPEVLPELDRVLYLDSDPDRPSRHRGTVEHGPDERLGRFE